MDRRAFVAGAVSVLGAVSSVLAQQRGKQKRRVGYLSFPQSLLLRREQVIE